MVAESGTWVLGAPDALAARLRQHVPPADVAHVAEPGVGHEPGRKADRAELFRYGSGPV